MESRVPPDTTLTGLLRGPWRGGGGGHALAFPQTPPLVQYSADVAYCPLAVTEQERGGQPCREGNYNKDKDHSIMSPQCQFNKEEQGGNISRADNDVCCMVSQTLPYRLERSGLELKCRWLCTFPLQNESTIQSMK